MEHESGVTSRLIHSKLRKGDERLCVGLPVLLGDLHGVGSPSGLVTLRADCWVRVHAF